jgi:hypothetical protein
LPIDTENLSEVVNTIKDTVRRMAGRFPVAEKYIIIGSTFFNSILLVIILVFLYLGTKKGDNPIDVDPIAVRIDIPELKSKTLDVDSTYTLDLKSKSDIKDYYWRVEGVATLSSENTFRDAIYITNFNP